MKVLTEIYQKIVTQILLLNPQAKFDFFFYYKGQLHFSQIIRKAKQYYEITSKSFKSE